MRLLLSVLFAVTFLSVNLLPAHAEEPRECSLMGIGNTEIMKKALDEIRKQSQEAFGWPLEVSAIEVDRMRKDPRVIFTMGDIRYFMTYTFGCRDSIHFSVIQKL